MSVHIATRLSNLAALYEAIGDYSRARPLWRQTIEIYHSSLERASIVQSERQQLAMGWKLRWVLDRYLYFSLKADLEGAAAYVYSLLWKGSIFARQRAGRLARSQPELKPLFDQLQSTSSHLATLSLTVPTPIQREAWQRQIAELSERKEELESKLTRRSASFRCERELAQLTPAALRAVLPEGTALVDLLKFSRRGQPQEGQGKVKSQRYLAAFIVRADAPIELINLGPIEPIERAVQLWREAIEDNLGGAVEIPIAGKELPQHMLRRLIWEPLEEHLQGAKQLLISPDGAVAYAPLAALPGKTPGKYLIEERSLAVAPVPRLLPELLSRDDDQAQRPSSLLEGPSGTRSLAPLPSPIDNGPSQADRLVGFHPGLLSGLAMTGANLGADVTDVLDQLGDDGILTALEVAELDLQNANLVVLSACETGLGRIAGGEGLLGLQRAFQMAGARTVVASLWKVDDEKTRNLMIRFYKNVWQQKMVPLDALREAQLSILNGMDLGEDGEQLRGPGPSTNERDQPQDDQHVR